MNDGTNSFQRRSSAIDKKIIDVKENDIRVRIIGTVINKTPNSLMIDDGTGKLEILLNNDTNNLNYGDMVKVIVRVLPLDSGFESRAECMQNISGFDINLFKRAKDTISKLR